MPILPEEEQLLQAVFDWARRLFRRKGLNAQDAEDCAAEVRLQLLQTCQQGRSLSFAYAAQVARGILADFVSAQQRHPPIIPLENADWHGGGGAIYGTERGCPLGVGAAAPWSPRPRMAARCGRLHHRGADRAVRLQCGVPAPAAAPRPQTPARTAGVSLREAFTPKFPPNLPRPLSHFARCGGFYRCDSRQSEVLRCAHEFGGLLG